MKNRYQNKQRGFSLIEVLVTSLIISVGVVGLVSLQINELRTTRTALVSNHISVLLNDMTERMRANPSQIATYDINYSDNPAEIDCRTQVCSAAQIAEFDQFTWQTLLKNTLSSGGGEIIVVANTATIVIRWDQDRSGSTGTECPVKLTTDLDCLQVTIEI